MSSIRYYMDQDNDCHWYLIPALLRAEFEEWLLSEDVDPPQGVSRINSPTRIVFRYPQEEN